MIRCRLVCWLSLSCLLTLAFAAGCGQKKQPQDDGPSSSDSVPHSEDVASPAEDEPTKADDEPAAAADDDPREAADGGPILLPPPADESSADFEPPTVGDEPPPSAAPAPIPRDGFPRHTGSRDTGPGTGHDAPRAGPEPSGTEPSEAERAEAETPVNKEPDGIVRVYYATDRQPHLPSGSKRIEWSLYFPAIVGILTTLILGGAAVYLRGKIIIVLVAVTSFLVTAYLTQQMLVRMQQVRRAAEFGDRTYGETRHEDRLRQPVLELGVCEVSIPPGHDVGRIESPAVWRLEFSEDPEEHVVLQRTVRLETDDFYRSLQQAVDRSKKQQALVFIHGYHVGFDDAVKRTAQIVLDLEFEGVGICYSWPSKGGLADYSADESTVGWTERTLEGFLRDLAERSGAKTIHLIAHSMGNRALLAAIERMSLRGDGPKFGQVILAAPDVDAGEFRGLTRDLVRSAERVTLYASSNDRALQLSMDAHHYARAGLSGEDIVVTEGVETIDVSPIDTSLIGHSYYGDNPQLIDDLKAMINFNLPAANREWLERNVLESEAFYWSFRRVLEE